MKLATAVYTANKGYSWSNAVEGVPASTINRLYRFVSAARGDFPDPMSVDVGVVSDGKTVGVFTIQNVEAWDSEKRASDYSAFAFFPVEQAADIDFIELLNNDFFWTPTHMPPMALDYTGGPSEKVLPLSIQGLKKEHQCLLRNPRAIGDILSNYGARSSRWVCLMKAENILKIECNSWT